MMRGGNGDGVGEKENGVITGSGHGGDSGYQAEEAGEVGAGSSGRASNE